MGWPLLSFSLSDWKLVPACFPACLKCSLQSSGLWSFPASYTFQSSASWGRNKHNNTKHTPTKWPWLGKNNYWTRSGSTNWSTWLNSWVMWACLGKCFLFWFVFYCWTVPEFPFSRDRKNRVFPRKTVTSTHRAQSVAFQITVLFFGTTNGKAHTQSWVSGKSLSFPQQWKQDLSIMSQVVTSTVNRQLS